MAYLNNRVFDNGLTILDTEANRLDICSSEPTTYTEATSTYTLGNKTSYSAGSPTNGDASGRKVVFPEITDGSVTDDGTATHLAIVDTVNSRLLATQALSSSAVVSNGNTFTLTEFDITIPDPA